MSDIFGLVCMFQTEKENDLEIKINLNQVNLERLIGCIANLCTCCILFMN